MTAYAPLLSRVSYRSALFHIACIAGFLLLVLWFKLAAPYDNYFFVSTHAQRQLHIFARVAFAAYLFGMFFGSGQWLLRGITRHTKPFSLTACEEIAVSVLAGSAVIRIGMLLLGFLNLYHFWLILPLGVLALLGAGRLPLLLRLPPLPEEALLATRIARSALLVVLAAAVAAVLASKLIYPNGTGDYFTHYFHYYLHVIRNAGIWPNDVWYHFYISKGAGDVFFAMILSDPLAPAAVSFIMYLTGIALGYAFFRRMTHDALASLLASVMIAAAFIWTYESRIGLHQWAEFSKQHVITAVLFFGTVWAGWLLQELPAEERGAWRNVTAFIVAGLILLRPQFAALCVVYFALLAAIAVWRRSPLARTHVFLALVAAITAALMLAINYAITGVAEVTPFRLFWALADQERFSHWVSPFLMLLLKLGSSPDLGALATPDFTNHSRSLLLAAVFRFDLIMPYVVFLLVCFAIREPALWLRSFHKSLALPPALPRGLVCMLAMLLAAAILFFCNDQINSSFRLYMFCLYPVLIMTALPFALLRRVYAGRPGPEKATAAGMVLVALFAFTHAMHHVPHSPKWHHWWRDASLAGAPDFFYNRYLNQPWMHFARGQTTIAEAYAEQGFLWKPGIAACRQVRPDTRIWSSQITQELFESPHCRFETFFSYSMGPDWARILFDDADTAAAALKKQKLDYFLIDTTAPFFDILPYSPLFSKEQIGRHFGIAWSEGGIYLLTWRSDRTRPLAAEFYAGYRKSLKDALLWADFPSLYRTLHAVYADWKRHPHWPVAVDPDAPHPRGWQ